MDISSLFRIFEAASTSDTPNISIGDKLVPNLWAFLTQLLAFIIMIVIVIKLGYKPVHKFMTSRKEYVKNNLESAAKSNSEAQKAVVDANANLVNSRKEANQILLEAKKQAEADKAKYQMELDQELKARRFQAEADISAEKKQAILDAKSQIIDIALSASSSLLGREVNDEDNKKLVSQFVDDVSGEAAGKR